MYCSKCGSSTPEKLNYCNSCGEKLPKINQGETTRPLLNTLLMSIGIVSVAGLGLFVGLVAVLMDRGVNYETLAIISMIYLATLFGISFSLIRLMSKLIDAKVIEKTETSNQVVKPIQLPVPNTAQLEEGKQQPFSVVENTTRTFDEAFVKRN